MLLREDADLALVSVLLPLYFSYSKCKLFGAHIFSLAQIQPHGKTGSPLAPWVYSFCSSSHCISSLHLCLFFYLFSVHHWFFPVVICCLTSPWSLPSKCFPFFQEKSRKREWENTREGTSVIDPSLLLCKHPLQSLPRAAQKRADFSWLLAAESCHYKPHIWGLYFIWAQFGPPNRGVVCRMSTCFCKSSVKSVLNTT